MGTPFGLAGGSHGSFETVRTATRAGLEAADQEQRHSGHVAATVASLRVWTAMPRRLLSLAYDLSGSCLS